MKLCPMLMGWSQNVFTSPRAAWQARDEPCQKKLPFELWALMKAEGSAQNPDAQYVRANCIQTTHVGLLELATPEVHTYSRMTLEKNIPKRS